MAYSNPTYWDIDGVSLQTLAQNIETTTGQAPPPVRGDDVTIPYRVGQIWQPKTADSRIIPFQAWVRGSTPTGADPTTKSKRETFFDNWRALRNLIWRYDNGQFVLTKRFNYNGGIKVVSALASFNGGLEPTMKGPNAAKFTFDLKLQDPYFYDTQWNYQQLNTGDNGVSVDGDVPTRNVQISLGSPIGGVWVRNQTLGLGVRWSSSIVAGNGMNIDCYNYLARMTPSGTLQPGTITHYGSSDWMRLIKGAQTINMSRDLGSAVVQLGWKGAWI